LAIEVVTLFAKLAFAATITDIAEAYTITPGSLSDQLGR
jgi:hypothetical protein